MNVTDTARTIISEPVIGPATLHLASSDGTETELITVDTLNDRAFAALRDPTEFAEVEIGDWSYSLAWPLEVELGGDPLWRDTLLATGDGAERAFLEWRMRPALSLSKAAEALGVSRQMAASYSNGEKTCRSPILRACRGWDVGHGLYQAASSLPKPNAHAY
ncbi:DUF2442 domain-containing protein [Polymorphobacter megasporae]|uniref:DUF2442 domain-containing protein n=1 Tax=Glacieibacterium megasporae TaxID=2835787 RepID=UPI001C1E54DD|nr:DUF2442 domain-containing protein [Polymorphobacter megasporae]UAJ12493.1 DUF2442 domain-containing protein [Polymorphobacter megasporae]